MLFIQLSYKAYSKTNQGNPLQENHSSESRRWNRVKPIDCFEHDLDGWICV